MWQVTAVLVMSITAKINKVEPPAALSFVKTCVTA